MVALVHAHITQRGLADGRVLGDGGGLGLDPSHRWYRLADDFPDFMGAMICMARAGRSGAQGGASLVLKQSVICPRTGFDCPGVQPAATKGRRGVQSIDGCGGLRVAAPTPFPGAPWEDNYNQEPRRCRWLGQCASCC